MSRRAHLHQPDRRPERERGRGRGRALRQGRALRADGGGGLDPQGAVDDARAGAFRAASFTRYPARMIRPRPLQQPFPKFYLGGGSRAGLGAVGETFRRASVLGRPAGADRGKHRRDQGAGARAWPRRPDRLRHAAADDLPRGRERRLGGRRSAGAPRDRAAEAGAGRRSTTTRSPISACKSSPREHGDLLLPHLWTGITKVRPGAGIAVVGNPAQCAATLAAIHRCRLPFVLPVRLSA